MKYDCTSKYQRIKNNLLKEYGTKHLCGNCFYTTTCERAIAQGIKNAEKKRRFMIINAPFVTKFEIEKYERNNRDGFIKVYECNKFEFEGV
jgi:hypothetical protein